MRGHRPTTEEMSLTATMFDTNCYAIRNTDPVCFGPPQNNDLTYCRELSGRPFDSSSARLPPSLTVGGSRDAGIGLRAASVLPLMVEEQVNRPPSTTPNSPPTPPPPSSADSRTRDEGSRRQQQPHEQVLPVVVENLIRGEDELNVPPNGKSAKLGRAYSVSSALSSVIDSPPRRKIARPNAARSEVGLSDGLDVTIKWPTIAAVDFQLSDDSSCSSNGRYSDDNEDQKKLERKRERNKLAARKCRERKLVKISSLEEQCDRLRSVNSELLAEMERLKQHVRGLKNTLELHVASGCKLQQPYDIFQSTSYVS